MPLYSKALPLTYGDPFPSTSQSIQINSIISFNSNNITILTILMTIWRCSQTVDIVNLTIGTNALNADSAYSSSINGNNKIAPFQPGPIKENASFAINQDISYPTILPKNNKNQRHDSWKTVPTVPPLMTGNSVFSYRNIKGLPTKATLKMPILMILLKMLKS